MRGVVSGVMGVIGVIDVVEGAGDMRPERNPFVKLARKDVGAEELPLSLDGDMIYIYICSRNTFCAKKWFNVAEISSRAFIS